MAAKKKAAKKTTKKVKKSVKKQTKPVVTTPEVELELLDKEDYEPELFIDDEDLDVPDCDEDEDYPYSGDYFEDDEL
jgi:hypothetical protein